MYDMGARINARIDDELAAQLEELKKLTGKNLTELLEAALRAYYAKMAPPAKRALDAFKQSGLIGCAAGPRTLSRDYKRELTASLNRKHGHR